MLLKMFSVSEAARMPLVPSYSKFFVRKTCRWTAYTEVRCPTCLRLIFARALYLYRLFAKALERRGVCVVASSKLYIRV